MNVLRHNMRKHRFQLHIVISELINIPQLAGKVYVKIQIRNKGNQSNSKATNDNPQPSKSMSAHVLYQSQTEKEPIENNKVSWNYRNQDIILKIGEDQKTGLMENKWLLLKIYVEYQDEDSVATSSSSNKHSKKLKKIRLGKIAVNLTEYINFGEMTTNRYLLADSKINSICKISILMKHLDEKKTNGSSGGYSSHRSATASSVSRTSMDNSPEREFNVPRLETSHIFQGLNQVIDEDTNSSSFGENNSISNPNSAVTTPLTPPTPRSTTTKRDAKDQLHARSDHKKGSENMDSQNKSSILTDPTLNYLISKTLQYSWFNIGDNFYPEFTPSECVEDIFYNGTGWKRNEDGVAFIDILHGSYQNSPRGHARDSEVRSQWMTKMQHFDENKQDPDEDSLFNDLDDFEQDQRRRTPKLLGLADLRDDLKSWNISLDPKDKTQA